MQIFGAIIILIIVHTYPLSGTVTFSSAFLAATYSGSFSVMDSSASAASYTRNKMKLGDRETQEGSRLTTTSFNSLYVFNTIVCAFAATFYDSTSIFLLRTILVIS